MKFSAVLLSALVSAVYALPQDSPSAVETTAPSSTIEFSPTYTCISQCPSGDVTCQAACVGVARPNESQVQETTQCAMECDQGNGSPEDTEAYAACQQDCIARFFPSSQTGSLIPGGPATTGASGAAPTGAQPTGTGENGAQETGPSATGADQPQNSEGAASNVQVGAGAASIAGLFMALFAL